MTMEMLFVLIACMSALWPANAYHDLSAIGTMADYDFHCWPLGAGITAYDDCDGLLMTWIDPPPTEIKVGESITMTYELTLANSFWSWAVGEGAFDFANQTTASDAKNWCLNTPCSGLINQDTCCIYHVNVHSCPLDTISFCGPWIPPNGTLFTHSTVLFGPVATQNWTSTVEGLYQEGPTQLIAHFKIGNMQTTLHFDILVTPAVVCGDAVCEVPETCSTCPADCGTCPLKGWMIALIALAGGVVIFIIVGMMVYFQIKQRKLLMDESWIVPYEDIKPDNVKRGFMGSAISLATDTASQTGGDGNALQQNAANKQIFAQTAIVNGTTVAVRKTPKKTCQLTKAIRKEVKDMRVMEHANLNKFIGACLETPENAILMEYCPKGSINDVLMNEDVPLNWGFRFSFATDICRGLRQLHAYDVVHGRLTSNNCIIDDRWTVKVTDYGLPQLRAEDRNEEQEEEEEWKMIRSAIYRGPETLQPDHKGPTKEGDVYAFSMILIEIATRNEPHGDEDSYGITAGWKPSLPEHDTFNSDDACPCPQPYNKLISDCWQDNPTQRPDFELVKKTLSKINPNKQSPIDLMMAMMEKYSKHLESIVAERTADLVVEKQKTDRLLYSMLPRKVADGLRQGQTIDAEQFSECTIYFSDIVGFTKISGDSTPFEVVALLNKLYTCFDSIIDEYDVYKVETIGDAYMVVSGVPVRNGILHAREIANMSLDLVAECLTFIIPHKPDEPLKIRVGMHTGPVCAGVVGLKMPRYCLFGDTVNTASRMESNGEAYKIHVSNTTYVKLAEIGGFKCELRGTIPVKGKGDMKTWWLTAKTSPPPDAMDKLNGELDKLLLNEDKDSANRKISSISAADSGFNDKSGEEMTELAPVEQKVSLPNVPEKPDPRPRSGKSSNGTVNRTT